MYTVREVNKNGHGPCEVQSCMLEISCNLHRENQTKQHVWLTLAKIQKEKSVWLSSE